MYIGQLVNQVMAVLVTKLDGTMIDTYTDEDKLEGNKNDSRRAQEIHRSGNR